MKTKKTLKQFAQDELMSAMQTAFFKVSENQGLHDYTTWTELQKEILQEEMSSQMERIEKLFNYQVKSWARGC